MNPNLGALLKLSDRNERSLSRATAGKHDTLGKEAAVCSPPGCWRKPWLLLWLLAGLGSARAQTAEPIRIEVDARDAVRNVVHAHLVIPVKSGPLTLSFPKWLQGEHAPTGPITDLVGFFVSAKGERLAWRRDPLDMHSCNLVVPTGAGEIEVNQDFLLPTGASGFTSAASATENLFALSWNQLLVYPKGDKADRIQFSPSLVMPDGWDFGTALHITEKEKSKVRFATVDLTTLIDSPVLMGRYFRTFELSEETPRYYLHAAADSPEALELKPEVRQELRNLVAELGKLFATRPHSEYHFLLSLSDSVAHFGLEHHECTDIRYAEQTLTDTDLHNHFMFITAHEVVHSWNGKYRRPAGLVRDDPQQALESELLWVYEGLTSYLGYVLTARSGLWTPELFHENLALLANRQDQRAGRTWRPLADTCVAAQLLYPAADAGSSWRRSVDFYDEGLLIWLEVDTTIRQKSEGTRSLDDFCRAFFGGLDKQKGLKPYQFQEVVDTLNGVVAHDWKGFLEDRIYKINPHAPVGGITASGWKIGSSNAVPSRLKAMEAGEKVIDLTYSVGLFLSDEGLVKDVIKFSPADQAGVVAGSKLLAVNGRRSSAAALRQALRTSASSSKPIELLTEKGDRFHSYAIDYHGGERYPVLFRSEGTEDTLAAIIKPLAARPGAASKPQTVK